MTKADGSKLVESGGNATDEVGSVPILDVKQEKAGSDQRRAFLSSAMRDLSEEELDSPAARRFLLAEIQRLDRECDDFDTTSKEYNDLRVSYARLDERFKTNKWLEVLSFVAGAVGSAGLGAAPSYMALEELGNIGWVFAIGSGILLLMSVIFKVFR